MFTEDTVKAAFKATGVYPYDQTVIRPEQMKPSKATSVKGPYLLPQTSPICAIMAAFHHNPRTAFDLDPVTHAPAAHPTIADPNVDPTLYTPSKHVCFMTSGLMNMSGSFLVS